MIYCGVCGARCEDDHLFCANCGNRLPSRPAPDTEADRNSDRFDLRVERDNRVLGLRWTGDGYLLRKKPYSDDNVKRDLRLRIPSLVFTAVGVVMVLYLLFGYDLTFTVSGVTSSGSMYDLATEGFDTVLMSNDYYTEVLGLCAILAVAGLLFIPSTVAIWSAVASLLLVYASDEVYAYLIGTTQRVVMSIESSSLALSVALIVVALALMLIGWYMNIRYCAARYVSDPGAKKSVFQYWLSTRPKG